jgi:FMN phosphatase YigB (HAD superfamily)
MGGVAAVAYKMGKGNAQKVEEYTGKPVDTLTDEELAAAMEDLDIELPEEENEEGGQFEDEVYEDEPDYMDELERLAGLKEKGIISEEDYEAKKKQLLGL